MLATRPIRVLLADDQPLLLSALSTILNSEPDIEVVAKAKDGADAVRQAAHRVVDVVVMDVAMPVLDGISAAQEILAMPHPPKVLMLTTFNVEDNILSAINSGVQGFLLKDSEPEVLFEAVRCVSSGKAYLDPSVTPRVLAALRKSPTPAGDFSELPISVREKEVLKLVAQGKNNQEISEELRISLSTTKSHVSSLLDKLQARDRVALVVAAFRMKLVD
ncbi:response regulator transcription factor [Corynebacterium sp. H128]|uniref:response regulator transcription factor n=1 Tax=unclassified Corynebacterium TaxID=2624378 RepID=UPI0030A22ECC